MTVLAVAAAANMADESLWGKAVNSVVGSSGIVRIVTGFAMQLSSLLFAIGFLFSNVIPTLPYLMWFLAIIGYVTYILESVLAAPFWASMHTQPDGHDIAGGGLSGYPIVLTLVIKPTFMIFGLICAMAVERLAGWFLDVTFRGTWESMSMSGFNVWSILGYITMYGAAYAAAIYKSYSLTYELPNAMLRWMGVGAHHQDFGEKEAETRVGMVSARVGGGLSQGLSVATQPGGGGHAGGGGGGAGGGDPASSGSRAMNAGAKGKLGEMGTTMNNSMSKGGRDGKGDD